MPFVAERAYVPTFSKQDLDEDEFATLRVTVVAREITTAVFSRTPTHTHDYVVNVGVQQRIDSGPLDEPARNALCDPLMRLVEEIVDLFRGLPLPGFAPPSGEQAVCIRAENTTSARHHVASFGSPSGPHADGLGPPPVGMSKDEGRMTKECLNQWNPRPP